VGSSPVFGVISFNTVLKKISWTAEIINKLQFISQVISNALSRKHSENILRESEERLRLAASSAEAGYWDIILNSNLVWVNEGTRNFYNFKRGDIFPLDDFIKKIHPDDKKKVKYDILNSVQTGKYYNEHRILLPDGKIRWIMGRGSILYDKENKPERLIGVSIDITNSKEFENALKNSEKLKSSILDSIYSHILVLDSKGVIISVNKSWRQFTAENQGLGKEFNIAQGDNYLEIIENVSKDGSKDLSRHFRGIKSVINGKSPKYESQYSVKSDINEFWFLMYVIPLENERKNFILVNIDITELKKTQKSLENALDDVKKLKEQLQKDNIYLKEEIKLQTNFEHILGNSDAIKYCLFNVEKVAPLNTTVLIYGETGTGKELIARAIHNASPRSSRPLIKVDCASLPPSIIESALFGHEKGAFTGAGTKIIGRFELANGSTLFLDEISELPLDLQSKLLRITQYGEFERLGSSKTHKTDVRLIAATNRDLEEEVKKGRFREDLFFRLNVFRITVPPLRERKEDIPEMVMEFLRNTNRKLGKKIEYISQKTLNKLISYPWPGNVRELENKIEYSVITTTGNELEVDLPPSPIPDKKQEDLKIIPLAELEREYIIKVLEMTDWKIEGKKSASEILKLAPSTLRDRIKKLKIKRK
jgi:PAS domain S-box-containing protein